MTFPDFEKLTPAEQLELLEKADPMECPFWMERLKTAVEDNAPQCLLAFNHKPFYRKIKNAYENLIKLKN